MKTKLTVSTDGINEEVFEDIEQFDSESEIEKYSEIALSGIADIMLQQKLKIPHKPLSIISEGYGQFCRPEWNDSIERLKEAEDDGNHLIDDIISLLRDAKPHIKKEHEDSYGILRAIVLDSCQMEDPSVL